MNIERLFGENIHQAIEKRFGISPDRNLLQLQQTRKEFEGDLTMVVFPYVRFTRISPEESAEIIGSYLVENVPEVE